MEKFKLEIPLRCDVIDAHAFLLKALCVCHSFKGNGETGLPHDFLDKVNRVLRTWVMRQQIYHYDIMIDDDMVQYRFKDSRKKVVEIRVQPSKSVLRVRFYFDLSVNNIEDSVFCDPGVRVNFLGAEFKDFDHYYSKKELQSDGELK